MRGAKRRSGLRSRTRAYERSERAQQDSVPRGPSALSARRTRAGWRVMRGAKRRSGLRSRTRAYERSERAQQDSNLRPQT